MPDIEITQHDFARLKRVAEPLVDTAATAFTKVMDFFEYHNAGQGAVIAKTEEAKLREFAPENKPPLVHTKLLFGSFSGKEPKKSNWDSLVRLALITTFERYVSVKELRRMSGANVVEGKKEDDGYKPIPGLPFSYQGMSAEDAAQCVERCAKAMACEAIFEFEWRQKDDAHMPGKRGRVRIPAGL